MGNDCRLVWYICGDCGLGQHMGENCGVGWHTGEGTDYEVVWNMDENCELITLFNFGCTKFGLIGDWIGHYRGDVKLLLLTNGS